MKVCKFGGSSLADAACISGACDIVLADDARRIMVVSAPGKRDAADVKITDHLIGCGERTFAGEDGHQGLEPVVNRFAEIQQNLGLTEDITGEITALLRQRLDADRTDVARYTDGLKAAGEDCCARLVAAEFRRRGHPGRYVDPGQAGLLMLDEGGQARVLPESYENLSSLADTQDIIVFPGFFGYTPQGAIITFSRGGSDITGSILAAAVGAELYENFTDVDSVFAADPRIVSDAAAIPELTYREMRELAYAGFNVLHDEAIIPAVRSGIPIQIRNTQKLEAPGTTIVPEHRGAFARVVGIACAEGFCTIYVRKYLMNREIGFGRRLLQILEEEEIPYEHLPSGIDDMSIILKEAVLSPDKETRVTERIRTELEVDDVEVERGLALLMVVGEGMRYNVGVSAKATRALADNKVNIEMMNQGSSEISIMFGLKSEDRERAVSALHAAFFE
jgi:aspartate kinase